MYRSMGSRKVAKERLRLVLAYDRGLLSQGVMGGLREDLLQIINRYLPLREGDLLTLELEKRGDRVVLVGTISFAP